MVLTDVDKKILSYIELQADTAISNIAKKLNLRTHTVYYVISKLERDGIIKKVPFINMALLGYSDYYIFFSLSSHDAKEKKDVILFLKNHGLVTWLVELGGEYQYIAALYIKNTVEFSSFLREISNKFGNLFFKKAFSLHTRFARFNRTYLYPQTQRQFIATHTTEKIVSIDNTDRAILDFMTSNPEKSQQEIARILKIPFSTLHYRLKILKKNKIFDSSLYFIDTPKIGIQAFELLIYTRGLNPNFSDELFEFAKNNPNIVHFVQSIGSWDFELGVEVENMYDAMKISEELYSEFRGTITAITTIPLFRQLKFKFYRSDTSM